MVRTTQAVNIRYPFLNMRSRDRLPTGMPLLVIQTRHPLVSIDYDDASSQSLVVAHPHRRTQSEVQSTAERELEQNPPAEIPEKVLHTPQTFGDDCAHYTMPSSTACSS